MSLFITLEGIDGAGKSTQAGLLADQLAALGHRVITTREPGGSPGAEDIRALLVAGEQDRWSAETEILLFTAARRDHVERTIQPALDQGTIVICDRFVDSTRAYQGSGRLREKVEALHAMMIGTEADLTLIFDLDPAAGLQRTRRREAQTEDRFERKGLAFQTRLRAAFLDIAAADPGRCHIINAEQTVDQISADAFAIVSAFLTARHGG